MVTIPKEYKILGAIAVGAIALGILLFVYGADKPASAPLEDRVGAYTQGNPLAKVTITEFADFQCPACKTAQATVDKLKAQYREDIKFVFRHFPLPGHAFANISSQAAEAAGAQGKFWEMHDLLYEKQEEWGSLSKNLSEKSVKELFSKYAKDLGLDQQRFNNDLEQLAYSGIIAFDTDKGVAAGVNATPSFFVNKTLIANPNYEAIKQEIDKALAQ